MKYNFFGVNNLSSVPVISGYHKAIKKLLTVVVCGVKYLSSQPELRPACSLTGVIAKNTNMDFII